MRLFRAAAQYPPHDREYRTFAARGRALPENATDEQRRSWDALSAWSTVEGARAAAVDMISARCIVSYDIPDDCGVTYEPSGPDGHYDIRGNFEELKHSLTADQFDL